MLPASLLGSWEPLPTHPDLQVVSLQYLRLVPSQVQFYVESLCWVQALLVSLGPQQPGQVVVEVLRYLHLLVAVLTVLGPCQTKSGVVLVLRVSLHELQ